MQKIFLFHNLNHSDSPAAGIGIGDKGIGVEAFVDSKTFLYPSPVSKGNGNSNGKSSSPGKFKRNPWSQ